MEVGSREQRLKIKPAGWVAHACDQHSGGRGRKRPRKDRQAEPESDTASKQGSE